MKKPNLIESVQPLSGQYSCSKDFRLNAWMLVAAVVYALGISPLRRHPESSPLWRAAITLAPLLPGLLYVRSGMRFVRGMDELQRRIQLEAWLFAAMGTVFVETALNALHANGVPVGGNPHGLGLGQAFILMFFLWIIGSALANRRYK